MTNYPRTLRDRELSDYKATYDASLGGKRLSKGENAEANTPNNYPLIRSDGHDTLGGECASPIIGGT